MACSSCGGAGRQVRVLQGQCVSVQLTNGNRITGFANAIVDGMLILFVSGQSTAIPVAQIQRITPTTGLGC